MGTTKTKTKTARYRLYFRPAKPASWWPRKGRIYAFVGCLAEGGWCVGPGDVLTREEVATAKTIIGWDHKAPLWRLETVPDLEGFDVLLASGAIEAHVLCVAHDAAAAGKWALAQARVGAVDWPSKIDKRNKLRVVHVRVHTGTERA